MSLFFPAMLNANCFNLSKPTRHRFPRWHSQSRSHTHSHSCVLNYDGIKLKTFHCRYSNLLYTDRSEIIVLNKKSMSQMKASPVTDFRYETKVGFSFIVGGARPLTPKAKLRIGGTFLVAHASGRFPTSNRNTFLFLIILFLNIYKKKSYLQ